MSLLAIADCQPPRMLNVKQLSRAGSLPHWVVSGLNIFSSVLQPLLFWRRIPTSFIDCCVRSPFDRLSGALQIQRPGLVARV
ncbi:hypothetical protein EB795_08040 [Pseudomonas mandelii]|nr:hypothetical protein [Pseudomonas mandelii]